MVPGLYRRELSQRRQFWMTTNVKETLYKYLICRADEYYFAPDEMISLALEYIDPPSHRTNTEQSVDLLKIIGELSHSNGAIAKKKHISHRRYLHCPAAMKILDMYKFIRLKYNLKNNDEVVITLNDVKLPDYFSLMDTAYTFSWTREKPLHLCYQIFERTLVYVPVSMANKMYDDVVPAETSDYLNETTSWSNMFPGSGKSSSVTGATSASTECNTSNLSKPNLKRKSDSVNTPTEQSDSSDHNPEEKKNSRYRLNLREASVKIPRIEKSEVELDVKSEEPDIKTEAATKLDVCATGPATLVSMFENYTDYEQDIEEVRDDGNEDGPIVVVVDDDDDDDDDDCLSTSRLSEEDTLSDKVERGNHKQLNTETLDWENSKDKEKEFKSEDNKVKNKRKNKKSKRHHHKHHHRHHERKKMAPQATILHSTDTDIMKLKVKLNTVNTDAKHHKQSKHKHRKIPENYFSFSSGCSVGSIMPTSPDTNTFSQPGDEDSSHSEISEFSLDSNETYSSKEENNFTQTKQVSPCSPQNKRSAGKEVESESKVTATGREGLLRMRNFRSNCVPPVGSNDEKVNCTKSGTKNDDNNNDEDQKPLLEKADASVNPSTSIALTVSKVTAAEVKKEQQKQQFHNGHKEESPTLEITVFSAKSPEVVPVTITANISPCVCGPLSADTPNLSLGCKGNNVTVTPNKTSIKPIKPIPAAIPLSQYQKMKSTKQTALSKLAEQHNFPRSLSITPHMVSDAEHLIKTNTNAASKTSDLALTKIDLLKQSITISVSENDAALDLSANKVSSAVTQNKIVNHRIQNNSSCYTCTNKAPGSSNLANMSYPFQRPIIYPVKMHKQPVVPLSKNYRMTLPRHPSKSQTRTNPISLSKTPSIPLLNEMKIVHPGPPNQNIRSIPDLSNILINRHHFHQQALATSSTSFADHQNKLPQNPLMAVACSLTNLKTSSDKCPASLPISKQYLDRTGLMVTK